MADKYRNEKVDEFMESLEKDLAAMVGKEFGNLDVAGVLERNRHDKPEMGIEEATMWAMRDKAAVVLRKVLALATCMDRTSEMVKQMTEHLKDPKKIILYRKRLEVLLELDKNYRKLL